MKRRQLLETDLFRKVACLPHENGGSVLIPLLHGIEHRMWRLASFILINLYVRDGQSWSWRATVLQSFAPTLIKLPCL